MHQRIPAVTACMGTGARPVAGFGSPGGSGSFGGSGGLRGPGSLDGSGISGVEAVIVIVLAVAVVVLVRSGAAAESVLALLGGVGTVSTGVIVSVRAGRRPRLVALEG
ncbi:hypothetical protein K353_06248 [Kitasatospora sp. SolWspMP-SS2h]|uniref:hypothetical protein n=1 Tax=Kitasatospora sp. SolWspMP-SS2h TaxID=1305729 RepID=UPI000DBF84B3|nr:hypothetical protein [Kitasatospora sp. SolWspMP-SS2h]RAJ31238.1 hypothetical protein K353_06248 [Kitasatospora sp. SolWspMP-SS2h]